MRGLFPQLLMSCLFADVSASGASKFADRFASMRVQRVAKFFTEGKGGSLCPPLPRHGKYIAL